MTLTWDDIENQRDKTYWRTRARQVRTIPGALGFVEHTGFCFAFKAQKSELPCLWHAAAGQRNPDYPKHTHRDPFISLVWRAKDELPAEKKIYYGKALKKRPTMISLEYLPYFYCLHQRETHESYVADYMRGTLSSDARRIMDALTEQSPQITADLKMNTLLSKPENRSRFDKAMAELQMKMYIVKIAEFYDPFTFLWELVDKQYTAQVEIAKKLTPQESRIEILKKYFEIVLVSNPAKIKSLFGWQQGIEESVAALKDAGVIQEIDIENEKKIYWGLTTL